MPRRRLLMACSNYWDSPFQVGSHHLARGFVRAGWEVGFVSDPISPWHVCRGFTPDLRRRFAIYKSGGRRELDGRLHIYVPGALLTPHSQPVLRSHWVQRHWHRWTYPNVAHWASRHGFGDVDLLYLDSPTQAFWLDAISYRQSVYRVADYNPHFDKYTLATRAGEEGIARRVDVVLYPSRNLEAYADELGARATLYLSNGVAYEHFARSAPPPAEYASISRPIAVYLGVMPAWFHFEWLRHAARVLPTWSFVLIGPDRLARKELAGLPNVHPLGTRPFEQAPAYLQHADVGIIPFDVTRNPAGVDVLNPQKLYAYLAAGLPVVASEWREIKARKTPAILCKSAEEFTAALQVSLSQPHDASAYRRFAAAFDWQHSVNELIAAIDAMGIPNGEPAALAG